MAKPGSIQALVGNLTQFQTLVLGFLGAMTFTGLYLSSRGDPIPLPLQLGFLGGVALVCVGAFQSMSGPTPAASNVDLEYFDKKKDKKEQRKSAKAQEKAAREELVAAEKAEAEARKAAAKKAKLAEEKAKKIAAANAEKQKAAAKQVELAAAAAGDKKKKKKPKKAPVADKTAAVPAAAVAAAEPVVPPKDDWIVAEDKFTARKAKKALEVATVPVQAEGAPSHTVSIKIAKEHYKVIIGAGSKNINSLQTMFSCKIQLPSKTSNDDTVTITGQDVSLLNSAKEAVSQLASKGYCKALSGDVTDVTMTINNIGLLIGPSGKRLATIREKTGVEINLPPKEERPKKGEKGESRDARITLVGDLAGIQTAMNAINQLMLQGFCELTHPDWVKITLAFPGSMLGILLGPKGASLRTIETDTETTIKVPNAKAEEDKAKLIQISIVGAIGNVEKARATIAAIQIDFVKREVDFPVKLLPALIGNKGDSIKKLQTKCNVRINIEDHIWDPELKTVCVEGFDKDCVAAISELNSIVASNTRVTCEFPTSRIGILIGKAGATISKIKDECKVRINVSEHEWDESVRVVAIDGLTADVQNAVAQIEALKVPPPKKERPAKVEGESADEGSAEEATDKPKRERRERRERPKKEAVEVTAE